MHQEKVIKKSIRLWADCISFSCGESERAVKTFLFRLVMMAKYVSILMLYHSDCNACRRVQMLVAYLHRGSPRMSSPAVFDPVDRRSPLACSHSQRTGCQTCQSFSLFHCMVASPTVLICRISERLTPYVKKMSLTDGPAGIVRCHHVNAIVEVVFELLH